MCISPFSLITSLPCYYPLHIIYFLHLLSTNHKCTQPCYFPPATQTCCSEDVEFFNEEFQACAASVAFLWIIEPSTVPHHESCLSP
jgi:hypothetical protein